MPVITASTEKPHCQPFQKPSAGARARVAAHTYAVNSQLTTFVLINSASTLQGNYNAIEQRAAAGASRARGCVVHGGRALARRATLRLSERRKEAECRCTHCTERELAIQCVLYLESRCIR